MEGWQVEDLLLDMEQEPCQSPSAGTAWALLSPRAGSVQHRRLLSRPQPHGQGPLT